LLISQLFFLQNEKADCTIALMGNSRTHIRTALPTTAAR
jgi:hypothetical protein